MPRATRKSSTPAFAVASVSTLMSAIARKSRIRCKRRQPIIVKVSRFFSNFFEVGLHRVHARCTTITRIFYRAATYCRCIFGYFTSHSSYLLYGATAFRIFFLASSHICLKCLSEVPFWSLEKTSRRAIACDALISKGARCMRIARVPSTEPLFPAITLINSAHGSAPSAVAAGYARTLRWR